jgi:hypothetical protein
MIVDRNNYWLLTDRVDISRGVLTSPLSTPSRMREILREEISKAMDSPHNSWTRVRAIGARISSEVTNTPMRSNPDETFRMWSTLGKDGVMRLTVDHASHRATPLTHSELLQAIHVDPNIVINLPFIVHTCLSPKMQKLMKLCEGSKATRPRNKRRDTSTPVYYQRVLKKVKT